MSAKLTEVVIAGLNLKVPACETREATEALVARVHAKLKDLESRSSKVNTQAFALQAAYEFAMEAAELGQAYADAESRMVKSIQAIQDRVEGLRDQIEEGSSAGTGQR